MSLNNWYLIESLERSKGLRSALTGNRDNVEIGFFAGAGHSGTKSEFCKGPSQLGHELKVELNSWLDRFELDMAKAPQEGKDQVVEYYKGLMSVFGRPYLFSQAKVEQEKGAEAGE